MVEEIVCTLDARVAKLEVGPPITIEEIAWLLDKYITRSKRTIA
jgi:hypothetical protein